MTTTTEDLFEIVYAIEGEPKPFALEVPAGATDTAVLSLIVQKHGLSADYRIFWEQDDDEGLGDGHDDEDEIAAEATGLLARLLTDFRQIHVARAGKIDVAIRYNARTVHRKFRPSAPIRRVIRWAISKKGLDLVGQPAEFQIKLDGKVIPPEMHLGQLARCEDTLALALVANVKPQG